MGDGGVRNSVRICVERMYKGVVSKEYHNESDRVVITKESGGEAACRFPLCNDCISLVARSNPQGHTSQAGPTNLPMPRLQLRIGHRLPVSTSPFLHSFV
jgi:hypothetical protein